LVVISVDTKVVDLFDRERENDKHNLSDYVMVMLQLVEQLNGKQFNEEELEGGYETLATERDEDMIVGICHIAETLTFGKEVNIETLNFDIERQRILNILLKLLQLK